MANINITFTEEDVARMSAELKQIAKRNAKIKEIYKQLFGEMSLTDKLDKFVKVKSWLAIITKYFNDNRELMAELKFTDFTDLDYYMSERFISELRYHFGFIELNFDELDLSDEDAELWEKSTVFWFTTGLWLVTVDGTDYIVHEMSGQGETLNFINTVDNFIIDDPNAKRNLSENELNKFAEQFKEFVLKCKN